LADRDAAIVAEWARQRHLELAVWDATADTTSQLLSIGVTGLCTDDIEGVSAALPSDLAPQD
jgi:hypothetical protein